MATGSHTNGGSRHTRLRTTTVVPPVRSATRPKRNEPERVTPPVEQCHGKSGVLFPKVFSGTIEKFIVTPEKRLRRVLLALLEQHLLVYGREYCFSAG